MCLSELQRFPDTCPRAGLLDHMACSFCSHFIMETHSAVLGMPHTDVTLASSLTSPGSSGCNVNIGKNVSTHSHFPLPRMLKVRLEYIF